MSADDYALAPAPASFSKNYNILCLGETGSGKTTTLAAIEAYISYATWKDAYCAKEHEFPTKIKFDLYRNNDNFDPLTISVGEDTNENHSSPGQSCTQEPKIYKIEYDDITYNFIDVPGSGDTRGIEQDDINSRLIIEAINKYNELHMILIFMKADDGQLTVGVSYCLNECMTKLHKENAPQIGFVITHARTAEYQLGNTVEVIKAYLENLQNKRGIVIKLTEANAYPLEHEAFRIFVALQQKPELLDEMNIEDRKDSWEKTRTRIMKLLQDIPKQVPQETIKLLSVNQARAAIFCLMKPLAVTINTIEANIQRFERNRNEIVDLIVNEGFELQYTIRHQDGTSMTVCTSEDCLEVVPMRDGEDQNTAKYKVCHESCYQLGIPVDVKGHEGLRGCEVFEFSMVDFSTDNEICSKCRCDFTQHMHIPVDFKRAVTERYVDRMDNQAAENHIQIQLDELVQEKNKILQTMAEFRKFLDENAILPINNAFEDMLRAQMTNEQNARNHDQVQRLQGVLEEYEEKVQAINARKEEDEDANSLTWEEVDETINELFRLKINGRKIQELYVASVEAHQRNNATDGD